MPKEKSEAEMRLLMMQVAEVEKNAPSAYPNYKRGICIALVILLPALLIGLLTAAGGMLQWSKLIWKFAAIVSAVAFSWGAFRPKR